jgi:hypothetical protein
MRANASPIPLKGYDFEHEDPRRARQAAAALLHWWTRVADTERSFAPEAAIRYHTLGEDPLATWHARPRLALNKPMISWAA